MQEPNLEDSHGPIYAVPNGRVDYIDRVHILPQKMHPTCTQHGLDVPGEPNDDQYALLLFSPSGSVERGPIAKNNEH